MACGRASARGSTSRPHGASEQAPRHRDPPLRHPRCQGHHHRRWNPSHHGRPHPRRPGARRPRGQPRQGSPRGRVPPDSRCERAPSDDDPHPQPPGPGHAELSAVLEEHRRRGTQLTRSILEDRFLELCDTSAFRGRAPTSTSAPTRSTLLARPPPRRRARRLGSSQGPPSLPARPHQGQRDHPGWLAPPALHARRRRHCRPPRRPPRSTRFSQARSLQEAWTSIPGSRAPPR